MQEMWSQSLGQDLLEKEMATDSSILTWRIPWTEEPGATEPWGHRRVRHDIGTKQQQINTLALCYLKTILTEKE